MKTISLAGLAIGAAQGTIAAQPTVTAVRIDGRLSSGKEEKRHAHDPITELTLLVVL